MKYINYIIGLTFSILNFQFSIVHAYRIELSNPDIADTPVFIAGYYGDQVFVVDSTMTDAGGNAVFERNYNLCTGMYTIVAPGKLQYDLLLDVNQRFHIKWLTNGEMSIEGDEQSAVWAEYQAWVDKQLDRAQIVERRRQIIDKYPDTFLSAYLTALQPVESPERDTTTYSIGQFMTEYLFHRRNYFVNMPLSDVRFLHTPLYREKVQNYLTKFVIQNADSLIFISYRMLEQAAGNYETFFYISDFLIDFAIRYRDIKDINKFHDFVRRNRDILGTKGMEALHPRSKTNYFALANENSMKNRLKNMQLIDIDGQIFDPSTIDSKYRVYFFWNNKCSKCIGEVPRLQTILKNYEKTCFGIAVNVGEDVKLPENRILAYDPQCVNVSAAKMPACETIFFVTYYSKIVITDSYGNIVGVFGSINSLDSFLWSIR